MKHEPIGTNLFDATQADEMVHYLIDGMPTEGVLKVREIVANARLEEAKWWAEKMPRMTLFEQCGGPQRIAQLRADIRSGKENLE